MVWSLSLTGGNFTVNNITFKGNSSSWAKVDVDLPVRAVGSLNAPSSLDIPVTITVPSNFTDKFSVIQTVVDVQTPSNLTQGISGIPIFITDNATADHQNLQDCNSFRDLQRAVIYAIIALILIGGALMALGYFVYRRSKKKSKENKASRVAKGFLILFVIMGFLVLITGLYLLYAQRILLS